MQSGAEAALCGARKDAPIRETGAVSRWLLAAGYLWRDAGLVGGGRISRYSRSEECLLMSASLCAAWTLGFWWSRGGGEKRGGWAVKRVSLCTRIGPLAACWWPSNRMSLVDDMMVRA